MFNVPHLEGIGKWLGSGIGQIFGSGDYTMIGPQPDYNVLTNRAEVPKFSSTRQTNVVCHREYLMDWSGSTLFNLQSFPLNPGIGGTFPWLSTIAQNYQEYKFHGLIFEFKPLITDFVTGGAPGVVIMSTSYNADAPVFASKQEMENSEYAVSVKPTRDMIHGVECADHLTPLGIKYVRTGTVPQGQDLRLYDLGNFQFANQGSPTQLLGEIWVSYCVEFFKPILPATVGGSVETGYTGRALATTASPLGTIQAFIKSNIDLVVTATTLSFTAQPGNKYLLNVVWSGSSTARTVPSLVSYVGLDGWNSMVPLLGLLPSEASTRAPTAAGISTRAMLDVSFVCSLVAPGRCTIVFAADGVFAASDEVSVMITELDTTVVSI